MSRYNDLRRRLDQRYVNGQSKTLATVWKRAIAAFVNAGEKAVAAVLAYNMGEYMARGYSRVNGQGISITDSRLAHEQATSLGYLALVHELPGILTLPLDPLVVPGANDDHGLRIAGGKKV